MRFRADGPSIPVELLEQRDIGTTQRYMHLSPAAVDAAIRLLETGTDTGRAAVEK